MSTEPGQRPVSQAAAAADPEPESAPLSDPKVMRALAHPVRTALLELLSVVDTITATQASEILGESPATCAFHLRTLGKYGFAAEAGGGRGRERPWTSSRRRIRISATAQTDRQAALAADTLSRFWFEQWLERARLVFGGIPMAGWEEATGWTRQGVYLTAEEAVAVMLEIRQILERYAGRQHDPAQRPPGALPVEWSVFSAPMAELAQFADTDGARDDHAAPDDDSAPEDHSAPSR